MSLKACFTRFFITAAFAIFAGAACPLAAAQTVTGTVQGRVTDQNAAAIPGVTITIRNVETGQERTVTTNEEGTYSAPFLPLGKYTVNATVANFGRVTRENIVVTLNQTLAVNFELKPAVNEEVTITAEEAPINTTNAEVKQSLNTQEITDKPTLNQGNFLTLAETFTGFQENPVSGQNNPTASSGSSINFNGTGTRGATFQINGVNNDDSSENQNRQGVSLATIKEFQVITNNFTAEFGRGYGAVVLVQTLSGTNKLHGSAYWFNQNSALNATNNVFSPGLKKAVDRRNQFGMTGGFPLVKNHLFGFVSWDHTEDTGGANISRDVFLRSEHDPANWFNTTPANNTPANRAFIQATLARFAENNVYPNDPTRCPRCWRGVQSRDFPARDYSGRFDWNARQSDTVTGRWQYTRQRFTADDLIIGERADQNNKQQNIGFTWTHIFSPTVVGEARYGLGLRTTLVNIAVPIQRYQTDNQFVYNLSTFFGGNHQFKAGTDIRRQHLDDLADSFSRGFYNFNSASCNTVNYGSGFNSLLNGCVPNFQKGFGPFFLENRINEYNFYGEDNWRVRPNLTLNLGLRYEYVAVPEEAEGRIDYLYEDDKDNIEPRVGFAWSPAFKSGFWNDIFGGPGESSIRGGYGIYHGRIFQSVFSQGGAGLRFNPPNALNYTRTSSTTAPTQGFQPTNLADPTGGFVFVPGPQANRHPLTIVDPGLEMPYTQQWNLSYERQLPLKSALRLTYTGNRGIGLLRFAQGNLPLHDPVNGVFVANHPNNAAAQRGQVIRLAADAQCAGTAGTSAIPFTAACPVVVPIGALEYSVRVPRTDERRPDPRYSTNLLVSNASWSYYHGFQAQWDKRLSQGLNFQVSYTLSKSIDTTSEATNLGSAGDNNQNGNTARISRGPSLFHTPHRFTVYGTYRVPFFTGRKDLAGQVLGGWQVSTVVRLASGTPFTVTDSLGADVNLDGFTDSRPVIINTSILGQDIDNPANSQSRLPRSAFRSSTMADYGNGILGRNTFNRDGQQIVDLGLSKFFQMPWEGHRFMVRADMFNALNHVWYGLPNTDIQSVNFGRITGTYGLYRPRIIQMALRYTF
ncbi:MAG: carboxypeptidase regulatory-like domain-containing protein [Acidobacteria bacterium]|nr:carboxypeptidase regulatory-like domain-containing protein [Acidobacteriota bacterium]